VVIYSEVERTVLLPDKKDGWASGRLRRTNKLIVEVLVQELSKGQLFETSERESIGHKVDMVVVGASRRKGSTLSFT